MAGSVIPEKFYFKIGEVSSLLGVKPYVVRFWENEFNLTPSKNRSRHRVYNRREVEALLEIKHLLYDERFTIEGAQKKLKERLKEKHKQLDLELKDNRVKATLKRLRDDLVKIRDILDR